MTSVDRQHLVSERLSARPANRPRLNDRRNIGAPLAARVRDSSSGIAFSSSGARPKAATARHAILAPHQRSAVIGNGTDPDSPEPGGGSANGRSAIASSGG